MTDPHVLSTSRFHLRIAPATLAFLAALGLVGVSGPAFAQASRDVANSTAALTPKVREGDYILAVVNNEVVTAGEVAGRIARVRAAAARDRQALPPEDELRKQVLDGLIDERAQLTSARETGTRVDDQELDRAVSNVAQQNQITLEQLKERLRLDGTDFTRFRNNVRDQLMLEHTREKEVNDRIKISDAEIDAQLEKQRAAAGQSTQYNIAEIVVAVPDNASEAVIAEKRAKALQVLSRVRSSQSFEAAALESSDDPNKAQGGALGLRLASKLPDAFVAQVKDLKQGEVSPQLLRTDAGFHILKLVERREGGAFVITQTHARHILLRPSPQLSEEAAIRRLQQIRSTIEAHTRSFDAMARENSEDGSAPSGGDLGWQSPGSFVPEFEEAMNQLQLGGISDPVVSRFGVHLIQVLDRRQTTLEPRQQREQARNIIREQKFDAEYLDWQRDLRARAYVEMREPPA